MVLAQNLMISAGVVAGAAGVTAIIMSIVMIARWISNTNLETFGTTSPQKSLAPLSPRSPYYIQLRDTFQVLYSNAMMKWASANQGSDPRSAMSARAAHAKPKGVLKGGAHRRSPLHTGPTKTTVAQTVGGAMDEMAPTPKSAKAPGGGEYDGGAEALEETQEISTPTGVQIIKIDKSRRLNQAFNDSYAPMYGSLVGIFMFAGICVKYASLYLGIGYYERADAYLFPVAYWYYSILIFPVIFYCLSRAIGGVVEVKSLMNVGTLIFCFGAASLFALWSGQVSSTFGYSNFLYYGTGLFLLFFGIIIALFIFDAETIRSVFKYNSPLQWVYQERQAETIVEMAQAVYWLSSVYLVANFIWLVLSPASQNTMTDANVDLAFLVTDLVLGPIIFMVFVWMCWKIDAFLRDFALQKLGQMPMEIPSPPRLRADPFAARQMLKMQQFAAQQGFNSTVMPFGADPSFGMMKM